MASARLTDLADLALEGARRVWAHRLRSVLTLSGLVLGVAALVAMFSFVAGVKAMVERDMVRFVSNRTIEFVPEPLERRTAAERASPGLRLEDVGAFQGAEGVARVHALRHERPLVSGPAGSFRMGVQGVTAGYLWDFRLATDRGRELTEQDVVRRHRVAVLGEDAARRLFEGRDPVGREIRIGGERYTVVGTVTAPTMHLIPVGDQSWRTERIYVPVTSLLDYHRGDRQLSSLQLTAESYEGVGAVIAAGERRLAAAHRDVPDFRLSDYGAVDYGEIMGMVDRIMMGWNIALGGIALISLLVGGIGLFSVLLISVRERVREIGVRAAVGASHDDIRREFLAESMMLAVVGAGLGVVGGAVICVAAEAIAGLFGREWTVPVSLWGVLIGVGFALLTGFLFGLYPARRAAALDPIEAITS